jgi:Flp pilus assembly pilin Flp
MSEIETPGQGPRRFAGDDGANLVEYSMLIALIVVVCLAAVQLFGTAATRKMDCASESIVELEEQASCAAGP